LAETKTFVTQATKAARELPTVKVVNPKGGFMIINEEDFDPEVHEKFEEE